MSLLQYSLAVYKILQTSLLVEKAHVISTHSMWAYLGICSAFGVNGAGAARTTSTSANGLNLLALNLRLSQAHPWACYLIFVAGCCVHLVGPVFAAVDSVQRQR
ncbi:hypothetical protein POX_g08868 [Penicillium oxalicum]|uniref:hypothetical protein n=1 Tax=Penicillium oxalicum TaxID=69781 RepID=UPI0020B80006|nr:hypothetical protein POX_g08868 [Penicillium oxalicum]KAI2786482.1 hypothetical protein POX_g08868 [Penicillium oxalicum]